MNNPKRSASIYKNANVLTASKETLLLMLYEGAIRFVKGGIQAIEGKKIEDRSKMFIRAQDIITELRCTLDFKVGGELAANLERLYEYITERLVLANVQNDVEPANQALKILEDLHQSWSQAIQSIKNQKENEEKNEPNLNVEKK